MCLPLYLDKGCDRMARTFRVYNGDTLIKQGTSPLNITGLTPLTTYDLKISAVEDDRESNIVDVPTFTTLGENILRPLKVADFTTIKGATIVDEGNGINLTSTGAERIQLYTAPTANNVLTKPLVTGKTYRLSATIKFDAGYSPSEIPLRSFVLIITGMSPSTRLILTRTPVPVSTTEYLDFSGEVGITGDVSQFTNYYLIMQSDNGTERFTGTIHIKDMQLREIKEV